VRRALDSLVTQMHSSGIRYEDAVREFKKQYLREVLMAHRGNQCKAAEELGMHRNTLSRAMAELGLSLAEVRATSSVRRAANVLSFITPCALASARADGGSSLAASATTAPFAPNWSATPRARPGSWPEPRPASAWSATRRATLRRRAPTRCPCWPSPPAVSASTICSNSGRRSAPRRWPICWRRRGVRCDIEPAQNDCIPNDLSS
jgi:Fis family transcriptional regulator